MALDVTFFPMVSWPHDVTPAKKRRGRYTFRAGWADTLVLLDRELVKLKATEVRIGCGLPAAQIRKDGWPRGDAREPENPGVEVSFNVKGIGRIVYATDSCVAWQDNVRSIALGLEALRAVDRFGISKRGQQYAGFKELPAGADDGPSVPRGLELVEKYGGMRAALKATHPDNDGDPRDFRDVQAAKEQDDE